ncbi:MAG: DNA alkylation repair protein [Bacteroidetes bacterium]|nr:DNA alkylation repair protein [Bacteroidota bacterium]
MSRYMKYQFPFLGIQKPIRSKLEKDFIQKNKNQKFEILRRIIQELWEKPEREFQYTAMELMIKSKIWKHKEAVNLLHYCLTHKSWWDTVDLIAGRMVGPYFLTFPAKRDETIDNWMNADNMWLNRTTLIFQLNYKLKTDEGLLFACIEKHIGSKEFFIKKAIGWALRQYARTNPDAVLRFVDGHNLSPLSKREALKHFSKA